jgi:site-specific recombinase XerD
LSNERKRRDQRVVGRRHFVEDNFDCDSDTLEELFDIFIQAKEIEGLRERTITDHRSHFKYFREFLTEYHSEVLLDVKINIIRDYIHYLLNEFIMSWYG